VTSVLVVAFWKMLTGGLHLDGLADCLDGLPGGDAGRRLAIMRDSRIGVFGALGLIVCLLAGVAAVTELPARARWRLLLVAPMLGRLAPPLIAPWCRAATPGRGLGASFVAGVSRWAGPVQLLAAITLAIVLFGISGLAVVVGPMAVVFAGTAFVAARLGGVTGDVLGAGVEVGEVAVLLTGTVLAHLGVI
jgi:adenosylcobinamide-GDP ribazoletransferase